MASKDIGEARIRIKADTSDAEHNLGKLIGISETHGEQIGESEKRSASSVIFLIAAPLSCASWASNRFEVPMGRSP